MWNNTHLDRLRTLFADQFEPFDDGFLYRKYMKGEAFRVTASERKEFIAQFNRRLRYALWSIFPATLLLIGGLVVIDPRKDGSSGDLFVWLGLGLLLLPYWITFRWAWNGPVRSLGSRSPAAAARTRAEVQRIKFERMTYQQLGLAVGAAFLLIWKISAKEDVLHGWGTIWLVLAASIVTAAGVQAFRKWRHERTLGQ